MNIVFWGGIVLCLVLLWFLLSFIFKEVGATFLNLFNDAKREIKDDDDDDETEE